MLKNQLSYLFKQSLSLRNRFQKLSDYEFHAKLSPKALSIIFSESELYEYEFLSQVFIDEIRKVGHLKQDLEFRIILRGEHIDNTNQEFLNWASEKIHIIHMYVPNFESILLTMLPRYLKEKGTPADLEGLYYVANTYARVYESFISLAIEIHSTWVMESQIAIKTHLTDWIEQMLDKAWDYPFELQRRLEDAKIRAANGEKGINLNMGFPLDTDSKFVKKIMEELEKYLEVMKRGDLDD